VCGTRHQASAPKSCYHNNYDPKSHHNAKIYIMWKKGQNIHFFYDLNVMPSGHFFVILYVFSAMPQTGKAMF
jgi:hypothetical protein